MLTGEVIASTDDAARHKHIDKFKRKLHKDMMGLIENCCHREPTNRPTIAEIKADRRKDKLFPLEAEWDADRVQNPANQTATVPWYELEEPGLVELFEPEVTS
jgi:hypothetical protein